jgi:hypothetical protein
MYLADFDYNITYIQGEDNTAADALSRMPDSPPDAMLAACAIAYTRSPMTIGFDMEWEFSTSPIQS